MLSERDTQLLCEIGPGTPMGNLLRRYWHISDRQVETSVVLRKRVGQAGGER